MATKVVGKQETKQALLQVGMEVMLEKGYTNTGIQEILNILSVPKGSFYHYFDSKENYAVAIIHHFNQSYLAALTEVLMDQSQSPLQRLRSYCDQVKAKLEAQDCRKGCLIGNLSQEMSDQSELLRKELSQVIGEWRGKFAACIEEGQNQGEIKKTRSPQELAEYFACGWSGAVMRSKTLKNTEPLEIFIDLTFNDVLKA